MKSDSNTHLKRIVKNTIFKVNKNPLSKYLYNKEIKKRSKLSLTNILPLAKHINLFSPYTNEIHQPNDWYGHAKMFKKFLNLPESYQFKFTIEHGFYLTKMIAQPELESKLPIFLTYSKFRKNVLKKHKRTAFCVGPFINYAPHYLTPKQLVNEKKRLGKCLLFFPIHSSTDVRYDYNIDRLCQEIKKIGKNFKSIRVCVYWKDILSESYKKYENCGFECVTAGHILDPFFLSRLKSIIETSTVTVSNTASVQVGYCIFMNKPHYVMQLKTKIKSSKHMKNKLQKYFQSDPYRQVLGKFSKFSEKITSKQKVIVNKYWGVDQIKTKKEFLKIVNTAEEIYSRKQW